MIIGVASVDYRDAQWGATGWMRIGQWLPRWSARHTVCVGSLWHHHDHLEIEVTQPDGTTQRVAPDVVYLHYYQDDISSLIYRARASGQVVIQDLDDWYWGIDARHAMWQKTRHNVQSYAANIAASDLVTTTTPYLADRLAERFRVEIAVIPNHIDVTRFSPVDHTVDTPTLGWAGGTDRRGGDLTELKGVLSRCSGRVAFQHSGHLDGAPLFADEVGLPADAVRRVDRTTPDRYPELLDFQIGVVPLRNTPFNDAKSDLKGLEYAASGIPFVASPSAAYRALAAEWEGCFRLAKRPADWVKGIEAYLDPAARAHTAGELRARVAERDLARGTPLYLDLFDTLAAGVGV